MSQKERFAISTLLGAFLIHAIIATMHIRSKTYIYSYLSGISLEKFTKDDLNMLFSISTVIYSIFIIFGVIVVSYFNSVTISGICLTIRIICHSTLILLPDIRIFSVAIILSAAACGTVYLPVLLDIWKYFPNSKGVATSFVLSGFVITRLMFRYVTTAMINPDGVNLITGTYNYPKEINESFLVYLKKSQIFFAILSCVAITLIYPYDIYINLEEEVKINLKQKLLFLNKSKSAQTFNRMRDEDDEKESYDDKNQSYLKQIFDIVKKNEGEYEPFISLIISYPFLQLTFVFFFAQIYSVIELYSIRRLGLIFGLQEDFLSKASLAWKIINVFFFTLWGYYLDKKGIKHILMIVLTAEIINNALCYFIVQYKIGFIIFIFLSAAVNSANLSMTLTCYVKIFGDEKGILLYSISSVFINTFHIWRPVINEFLNEKVHFLMLFLIVTIFSMISLIILCFFKEKVHNYKGEKSEKNETPIELKEISTNNTDNNSDNNSLFSDLKKEK